MDDIDTIGKMITKAVGRVSRRASRREEKRRQSELRKEAESILLEALSNSGLTGEIIEFLDAKEKAEESEIRSLDDKDREGWDEYDPRWGAVSEAEEMVREKYNTFPLEQQLGEHFGDFEIPAVSDLPGMNE